MNTFITFLLVAVSSCQILAEEPIRYDNFTVYRVTPKSEDAVEALRALEESNMGYDFWTEVRQIGVPVDIMVPPHYKYNFRDILSSGLFDTDVYISDVQQLIDNERPKNRQASPRAFGWTDYNTFDEINAWLRSLATQYPNQVSLVVAGRSYEGRDILGVKVSFRSGNENRTVFLESGIHAREWISPAVNTYILNQLLTSQDANVRQVAESHDWYIVPVFNPDGYVYTFTTNRLWRKTRVPYLLCYGADPNRNWGYYFNQGGSSSSPCAETYNGPSAFSEPSTRTTSEFISTIGSKLRAYISFHSYSQLLLLPYGFSSQRLDNYNDLYNVGVKAASSLAQRYGTRYTVGNIVDVLYVASGGSMDWVKGTFKTPITYTYELRDTGRYGFVLPANQIIPSGEETLDSLVTILQEFNNIL